MSFIAGLIGSKTVWGIIITLVATVLKQVGIVGVEATDLTSILDLVAQLGGLLFALYGRIVAKGPIANP